MSGAKPEDIDALTGSRVSDLYDIERGTSENAMSIDLPLHDLVGNILNIPVYRLLGAKGPTRVPIYSSVEGIPGKATGMGYSAFRFDGGKLVVPNTPGFGIKLSF